MYDIWARSKIYNTIPIINYELCTCCSKGDVRINWNTVTKNGATLRTGDMVSVSGSGRLKVCFAICILDFLLMPFTVATFFFNRVVVDRFADRRDNYNKEGKICSWTYTVSVASFDWYMTVFEGIKVIYTNISNMLFRGVYFPSFQSNPSRLIINSGKF